MPQDVPQNGLAGFKHLRHDILSGIVVSLVSLPLSSGIAIASGVPPIYGLISAIIAGLVFPFIGGSYLTIAGPAAGLAPALFGIMVAMGGVGGAEGVGEGYHHLLVIIFMVGCLQLLLAVVRLAKYAAMIPVSVVEGMLASIGLLIIVKQLPMFFGYTDKIHAHEFIEFMRDIPTYAHGMTVPAFAVAAASLALLFFLGSLKNVKLLKVIPPQLIAVVFGLILGRMFRLEELGTGFLITLPKDAFHGFHLPDFAGLLARQDLWYAAGVGVVTLTMIDGVESLATAMAIDRIDPYHRKSQPNRLLAAMAISNIASSMVGGLTIIPGGVKSKANIASGGRTLWANFTNALCLIMYLWVGRDLINMIPKGVLASVLIYTGWKMCEPLVWKHMAHIGRQQLAIFAFTIVATLLTDLLWGIIAGVIAKYALNLFLYRRALKASVSIELRPTFLRTCLDLFGNPVRTETLQDAEYHVYLDKPLVCFNTMKVGDALSRIPDTAKAVYLHLDPHAALIDHTSFENVDHVVREYSHKGVNITFVGLDRMRRLSEYHAGMHVADTAPALAAA